MRTLSLILLLFPAFASIKTVSGEDFCKKKGNYAKSCVMDGKPGFCSNDACALVMDPTPRQFLIKIRYPADNKYAQNSSLDATRMFLRGSGLGLSWKKGKLMQQSREKDTWEHQLEFAIPGLELPREERPVARVEFRVYLDDTRDMLGPNFVLHLPLSTNTKNLSKIPEFWQYPWFFHEEGTVKNEMIFSPQLGRRFLITLNLPASFDENTYKKYETLIVNDGQRVELLLPQLNVLMVRRALMKEILVVGVHNDYANRTELLAVSNGSNPHCVNGGKVGDCNGCINCSNLSLECPYERLIKDYQICYRWKPMPNVYGEIYIDFIQDTLIPECKSSYRALSGAENFGIMGFSLGGLVSCHAIWTRPQTFGSAACMSPSLWWPFPENATFPDDAEYEFTRSTLWKHRGARPRQKIYIDVGGEEGYLMISPSRNASRILASSPYFEMNDNLWFYVWDGHLHLMMDSVQRMWVPLIAFYGTDGSTQAAMRELGKKDVNESAQNSLVSMSLFWICLFAHIILIIL